MFDFAFVCHMDARQMDALRYIDFASYIIDIEDYWKREKERWDAMNP